MSGEQKYTRLYPIDNTVQLKIHRQGNETPYDLPYKNNNYEFLVTNFKRLLKKEKKGLFRI